MTPNPDPSNAITVSVTLTVRVHDGVYWPENVREAVAKNDGDPWKDDTSHLVQHLVDSVGTLLGVEYIAAESAHIPVWSD